MELFSELYTCYYQLLHALLQTSERHPLTKQEINSYIQKHGFAESHLTILPKLATGEWPLFTCKEDGYTPAISMPETLPFTILQKRWLKALMTDPRIRLFLSEEALHQLDEFLIDCTPLFSQDTFIYYDQFEDGDDFTSPLYRHHIQTLCDCIRKQNRIKLRYQSNSSALLDYEGVPITLEYSPKNNRFRLILTRKNSYHATATLNVGQIQFLTPYTSDTTKKKTKTQRETTDGILTSTRTNQTKLHVTIHIYQSRNAMERAMLYFADYEKNTKKISDSLYECTIYYHPETESELLIDLLSFGPTIKVVGPERIQKQIKARIEKQYKLLQQTL